jgi:hypothetical protein
MWSPREMSNSEPLLVEKYGGFITRWHCDVPDKGVKFRVLRDEWHDTDSGPVRDVYEIQVSSAS